MHADCFASSYGEATLSFRAACADRNIPLSPYRHPARGPGGKALQTSVALLGAANARRILIVNCGTHGVEGLAGSGCIRSWLAQEPASLPGDMSVLLIHLLNPWGTAWRRRQTEGNIDLNRNFVDFTHTQPVNAYYETLRRALAPACAAQDSWDHVQRRIAAFRSAHGEEALAQAVCRGQYADPHGVGFGGLEAAWSNTTFRSILARHAARASDVVFIDLHTGLGPFGHGTLISTDDNHTAELARARAWFGASIVALKDDRQNMPYDIHGDICTAARSMLPNARVVALTLEFGTFQFDEFLSLQVRDCWSRQENRADEPAFRDRLENFFYPRDRRWREMAASRALDVFEQAITGLRDCP